MKLKRKPRTVTTLVELVQRDVDQTDPMLDSRGMQFRERMRTLRMQVLNTVGHAEYLLKMIDELEAQLRKWGQQVGP